MNLLPSPDQLELVAAATDFIRTCMPIDDIRKNVAADSPVAEHTWRAGAELGLLTLGLPEQHGGAGRSLDDEALLFVALGKNLATGPFLASTLAARVAALSGDTDLCLRIGAGTSTVGLAELRGDGVVGPHDFTGTFDLIDAAGCSHLLVLTRSGAALIESSQFGDPTTLDSVDPGTRLSTATVTSGTVARWLPDAHDSIRLRGLTLTAAFLAGLADGATELATRHAKTRIQFGGPIGVHQAIKHSCADMAVRTESALAQTYFAAVCLESGRAGALSQVLAARAVAATAAVDNAAACIHIHGGMGYTYEHNAHLYLKRAHVFTHLVAEPTDVLAELLTQEVAA